jgi:hypothetical protein
MNLISSVLGLDLVILVLLDVTGLFSLIGDGVAGIDRPVILLLMTILGLSFLSAGIIDMMSRSQMESEKKWGEVDLRSPEFLQDISQNMTEGHSYEVSLRNGLEMSGGLDEGIRSTSRLHHTLTVSKSIPKRADSPGEKQ